MRSNRKNGLGLVLAGSREIDDEDERGRLRLGEKVENRFAESVTGDVERAFFDFVAQFWLNADCVVDGGVEVFDNDAFFEGFAGAFISSNAVEITAFDTATEHQDRTGISEMTVHTIMFQFVDYIRDDDLVFDFVVGFAFDKHVAAEFAGEDDKRAIEKAAFFEVENELGDGGIDGFFEIDGASMAVFVGIPILEWNVFGSDLDEARARLGEPPSEKATEAEAASVVFVVAGFGFEGEVESFGGGRTEEAMSIVERAEERFLLVIAAMLAERALFEEFAIKGIAIFEA